MLFYARKSSKIRHHNLEAVGLSPASATKIIPDFDKKSGIFLTFWRKMGRSKMPWGIARGDSSEKCFFRKPGILNFFPVFCFPDFLLFQGKTGHKINIAVGVSATRIDGVFSFSTQQPVNGYIQDVCQGIQLNI